MHPDKLDTPTPNRILYVENDPLKQFLQGLQMVLNNDRAELTTKLESMQRDVSMGKS